MNTSDGDGLLVLSPLLLIPDIVAELINPGTPKYASSKKYSGYYCIVLGETGKTGQVIDFYIFNKHFALQAKSWRAFFMRRIGGKGKSNKAKRT